MSVYVVPPSPLDLYVRKSPSVTCLVVDLASVEGMKLTWSRNGQDSLLQATNSTKRHFNMTYTVVSTLPVDTNDWTKGDTYSCTLEHPHLPKKIIRSTAKAPGEPRPRGGGWAPAGVRLTPRLSTGKRVAPEVYVFLPSEKEQQAKSTVTLTCLIQNFFPADISVRWLQDGNPLPADQPSTTWPRKDEGPSPAFFVFSRLEVNRTHWERKTTFACQVVHEALPGKRKTLEKPVSRVPGN